jgi:NAD(P)H-hydrate epimerase
MTRPSFRTPTGSEVTAVTADEMEELDQVAVDEVGLRVLQMMENAGRILAWHVREIRDKRDRVIVVAGNGGNGGGGMVCARHLKNRGIQVQVLLDRSPDELSGVAATQYRILKAMNISITTDVKQCFKSASQYVVVDALIGYGLKGAVRTPTNEIITTLNGQADTIVSLDVPSGIDPTTGEVLGGAVTPDRTVTLELPKTGLDSIPGTLYLADISVPQTVYDRLDIEYVHPFEEDDWVELRP